MTSFVCSSNSGLEQKRSKSNLTESSAWGSTKYFQSKTLLKVKLYLSSSGLQSNTSQVRFRCNSNPGTVSAPILTCVNLFLFILSLTLLATGSSTSSSQLKFYCCWSDKYFFINSKCSPLISRLFDFLIVFSFE